MIMAGNEKRKSIRVKAKNLAQRQFKNSIPRTVSQPAIAVPSPLPVLSMASITFSCSSKQRFALYSV
jgi:hypothetical protein